MAGDRKQGEELKKTPEQPAPAAQAEEEAADIESLKADAAPKPAQQAAGVSSAADPQQQQKVVADLEKQVSELNAKLEAAQDKYLRLMAEFDNYKRRTSREYEQVREQATERLMCDLVEVKDNFDRALLPGKEAADYDAFHKGMQLIDDQFVSVLQKHGLTSFGEPGDVFNPELHEALMKQPHETIAEDHVIQVFDKGYKLRGKVIKHGRVIVSAGRPQTAAPVADAQPAPQGAAQPAAPAQTEETVFEPKP